MIPVWYQWYYCMNTVFCYDTVWIKKVTSNTWEHKKKNIYNDLKLYKRINSVFIYIIYNETFVFMDRKVSIICRFSLISYRELEKALKQLILFVKVWHRLQKLHQSKKYQELWVPPPFCGKTTSICTHKHTKKVLYMHTIFMNSR